MTCSAISAAEVADLKSKLGHAKCVAAAAVLDLCIEAEGAQADGKLDLANLFWEIAENIEEGMSEINKPSTCDPSPSALIERRALRKSGNNPPEVVEMFREKHMILSRGS